MNEKQVAGAISQLARQGACVLVHSGKRIGIEKELLRVNTADLSLAQTPHPPALGSTLTHPYITTDFSEAMIEMVTPPLPSVAEAVDFQKNIHCHISQSLNRDEMLWEYSMPCRIDQERNIPLAYYGTSNLGNIKTIYRRGLGYRYGRAVQLIAGIHFNYSYGEKLWKLLYDCRKHSEKHLLPAQFRNHKYMNLIRNFLRISWVIPYLFGCSPSMHSSFPYPAKNGISNLGKETLLLPYGTSLRMSDIGYQNNFNAKGGNRVSYNSLQDYIHTLAQAVNSPSSHYQRIGVKVNGKYRQLSPNLLQIENEHYSTIRPKRSAARNQMSLSAIVKSGVEYVELRAFDLNYPNAVNIRREQLYFVEMLFFLCLIEHERSMSTSERETTQNNEIMTACMGRDVNLRLHDGETAISIKDWGLSICGKLAPVADLFDSGEQTGTRSPIGSATPSQNTCYTETLTRQAAKFTDDSTCPSAIFAERMRDSKQGVIDFVANDSQNSKRGLVAQTLLPEMQKILAEEAKKSIQKQNEYEQKDTKSLDEFINQYLSQIKRYSRGCSQISHYFVHLSAKRLAKLADIESISC